MPMVKPGNIVSRIAGVPKIQLMEYAVMKVKLFVMTIVAITGLGTVCKACHKNSIINVVHNVKTKL